MKKHKAKPATLNMYLKAYGLTKKEIKDIKDIVNQVKKKNK